MRSELKFTLLAAVMMVSPVWAAPSDKPVSIANPAALASVLRDMGYQPGELAKDSKNPAFNVTLGDQPTRITFGACTGGVDCKYIYMSSSYSDVPNPPIKWLNQMNDAFDIIKVDTDADNDLFFSAAHVIEGIPRSTLRTILDMWISDAAALAQEAVSAKLNKTR